MSDAPLTARVMRRLLRQAIYFALLVVSLIWFLFSVRHILPLFLFSFILAYALARPVEWVARNSGRQGIPRSGAILLVYAVLLAILGIAFDRLSLVAVREVRAFATNWPALQLTLSERLIESEHGGILSRFPAEAQAWVEQTFYNLDTIVRDQIVHTAPLIVHRAPALIELIVVPIVAYYLLKDYKALLAYLGGLVQPDRPERFDRLVAELDSSVRGYLRGQAILSLVAGVLAFLILTVFGVHYAILVGIGAIFLELIPVVGPLIWAAAAVLLTAIQHPDKTLWVLGLVTLAHQADMHILAPKILGKHLRLHPAVVIFALVSGTALLGLLGALLAAPAAAVLTILLRYLVAEGALSAGAVLKGTVGRVRPLPTPDEAVPPRPSSSGMF
ncbi:MAG: AI-2E family transporter [Chloroflexota bacterium]